MTNIEKCTKIRTNPEAVKTANELLAAGNLTWDEVVDMTYMMHFDNTPTDESWMVTSRNRGNSVLGSQNETSRRAT